MSSVDNRIVQMEFDNQQFERGVKTTTSSLENLKNSLKLEDAGKGFEQLQKASQNVNLSHLEVAVDAIGRRFTTLGIIGVTALQNITNAVVNASAKMIKSLSIDQLSAGFTKYEQKTANVQAIMNATGKSVDEVNGYLDELLWFSDETSFGFTDMTQALNGMTSAGGDIATVIPLITGLATATAFAGKSAADYGIAMRNITDSYQKGYLTGMDWKSLELVSVASKDLKQTFIDTAVAQGKIKKGTVTLENFVESLSKKKWADKEVMEATLSTWSAVTSAAYDLVKAGKFDTAQEAIDSLKGQYSDLQFRAAKAAQSAKTFTEAIKATRDAVSTGWMISYELIIGNIVEATALWSGVTAALWETFASGAQDRNKMLQGWRDLGGREGLLGAFVNIYNTLGLIGTEISNAFNSIFPPMTAQKLLNLTKSFESFTAGIVGWLQGINGGSTRLTQIGKIFKGLFAILDIGVTIISAIWTVFTGFLKSVGFSTSMDSILEFLANLGDSIVAFGATLKTIFGTGSTFKEKIDALFKPFTDVNAKFGKGMPLSNFLTGIGSFFSGIVSSITGFVTSADSIDLAAVFAGLFGMALLIPIFKFIAGLSRVQSALTGGISNLTGGLMDMLGKKDISTAILQIAGSIALLAASLYIVSKIDPDRIVSSLAVLGLMIGAVVGLALLMAKMRLGQAIKLGIVSTGLVILAVAINLFAIAIAKLGNLSAGSLGRGLVGLAVVFVELGLFMLAVKKIDPTGFKGAQLILLAISINLFAIAIEKIGTLAPASMVQGLVGLGLVMAELALFLIATKAIDFSGFSGFKLILLAVSINLFAMAIAKLGKLDGPTLAKGLAGLGTVMLELAIFLALTKKIDPTGFKGGQLLLLAISINLFAIAISKLGGMSTEELIKGVVGLGFVMLELVAFLALTKKIDPTGFKGGQLLVLAISINLFAVAISTLGSLDSATLVKGLVGLGVVMLEIVVFLALTKKIDPTSFKTGQLLVLAISINLFAVAISSLGTLSGEALVVGLVGLGLVMLELVIFLALTKKIDPTGFKGGQLILLAIAINLFATAIGKIGSFKASVIAKGLVGLGLVLLELVIFMKAMSSISVTGIGKALLIMGVMALAMFGFAKLMQMIEGIDPGTMLGFATSLGITLLALSVSLGILSVIPFPAILAGIANLALIAAAIVALMVIFGAAESSMNLSSYVESFGVLMGAIGNAFGKFVSGFVAGAFEGFAKIGTELSNFMTNAQPFLDGVKKIDASAVSGVQALAEVILSIAGTNIVTAISSWLTGGNAVESFAKDMESLGKGVAAYAKSVSGFTEVSSKDTASATAAVSGIVDVANALPPSGGLKQLFTGGKDLGKFSASIPKLGKALNSYAKSVAGFAKVDVKSTTNATKAAAGIVDVANALPPRGGLKQLFTGGKDLASFSRDIPKLGYALSAYATSVKGFNNVVSRETGNATKAAAGIVEVANALPPTGGLKQLFTGGKDLANFADDIPALGYALSAYAKSVKGFTGVTVKETTNATSAAVSLAALQNSLPETGGLKQWFEGTKDLVVFSDGVAALGAGLKAYAAGISGFDVTVSKDSADMAAQAGDSIAKIAAVLPLTGGFTQWLNGTASLKDFSVGIKFLGAGLAEYATQISGFDVTVSKDASSRALEAATSVAAMAAVIPITGSAFAWLTGTKDIPEFAKGIALLGEGLKAYASSISGFGKTITSADRDNAAFAAGGVLALVEAAPTINGWKQWTDGVKSISTFASGIKALGEGLKSFAGSISGFGTSISKADSDNAVLAASCIVALVAAVPLVNGWKQWTDGVQSITTFATGITALGEGLKAYGGSIAGFSKTFTAEDATLATETGKGTAEIATALPLSGGAFEWFNGIHDLKSFSTGIISLGVGLKSYAASISGFSSTSEADLANALATAKSIKEFADTLPATGGWMDKIVGIKDLDLFSTNATKLGGALASFADNIGNVDPAKTELAMGTMTLLKEFGEGLKTEGGFFNDLGKFFGGSKDLGNFSQKMATFGTDFNSFASGIALAAEAAGNFEIVKTLMTSFNELAKLTEGGADGTGAILDYAMFSKLASFIGDTFLTQLGGSIGLGNEALNTGVKTLGESLITAINEYRDKFMGAGSYLIAGLAQGIKDAVILAIAEVKTLAGSLIDTINSARDNFIIVGINLMDGLAVGIGDGAILAVNAALKAASRVLAAINGPKGFIEESPSKATEETGKRADQGLAIGLDKYGEIAQSSGKDMASSVLAEIEKAFVPKEWKMKTLDDFLPDTTTPVTDGTTTKVKPKSKKSPTGISTIVPAVVAEANYIGTVGKGLMQASDLTSLGDKFDKLANAVANMKIVMDSGIVVGQIANKMDHKLGTAAVYAGRGN